MINTLKQKYVPCELSVVEFKVERGFAASDGVLGVESYNDNWHSAAARWKMFGSTVSGHTDFQNQKYIEDQNSSLGDWNIQL